MHILAITFDGDMTLWDFQKVMRHSLKHTLTELQRHLSTRRVFELTVDEMIEIRDRLAEEVKGKVWNLEEIRQLAFERTLKHVGCSDKSLATHLNKVYLKHRFEDVELYNDVVSTLDVLAPHFKLGLLSNGNSHPERCGLEERFDFAIFSQDVQVEKPDPKIFRITAQRASCQLDQLLHIGDSLKNDVAGARAAGTYSVWLNREGLTNDTEIKADYEVNSLTEIPAILGID